MGLRVINMPLGTWRSHLTWGMHDIHVWITFILVILNCLDTEVLQMTTGNVTDHCNYLRTVKPAFWNHSKPQPKDQSLSASWALADTQKGISHSMEPISRHFSILECLQGYFLVQVLVCLSPLWEVHILFQLKCFSHQPKYSIFRC